MGSTFPQDALQPHQLLPDYAAIPELIVQVAGEHTVIPKIEDVHRDRHEFIVVYVGMVDS